MIGIGSDHAAFPFKEEIKEYLIAKGYEIQDFGTYGLERVDYCDFGFRVGEAVARGECEKGLVFCGTGVGISISANKVKGIRAVVCSEPYSAKLSREHNDTNILALGARVVGIELATMIVDIWLTTDFEGGSVQSFSHFRSLSACWKVVGLKLFCSWPHGARSKAVRRWPRLRPAGSFADSVWCPTWLPPHAVGAPRPA